MQLFDKRKKLNTIDKNHKIKFYVNDKDNDHNIQEIFLFTLRKNTTKTKKLKIHQSRMK